MHGGDRDADHRDPVTFTSNKVAKQKSVMKLRGSDRSKIVIRSRLKQVIKKDVVKVDIDQQSLSCD